jgi:cytochrome c55X
MWRWRVGLACAGLSLAVGTTWAEISTERQTALVELLRQDCGSCHGLTLKGGLGPPLLPQALAGKPRDLLEATIAEGLPEKAMPPWKGLLSPEEIRYLVDQLIQGVPPHETP